MTNELNLPEGWEVKKLGEITTKIGSGATPRGGKKSYKTEGISLIRSMNVHDRYFKEKNLAFIDDEQANNLSNVTLQANDVLLNITGASVARCCIVPDKYLPARVNQHVSIIRPKPEIMDSSFLNLLLTSKYYKDQLLFTGEQGSTRQAITKVQLQDFVIHYPPLTEQKRIVAILDEAFESIAKAKENAENNLKNATEIFESYSQSVFENKGESWDEKTLGDVCAVIGGGTPSKANDEFYGGSILWATVRDMNGETITDTEHKITKDAVKNSSTNIVPKDNVIIATRVGLGKICLIAHDTAINQDIRGIIPNNSKVLSVDFLYRWFKSIAHKIVEHGTGATVQGVKLPFVKSLPISIPPLKEQQSIVAKLDALSAETKKLEATYIQKLADLEELKKSILQKAFDGELK